MCGIAGVVLQEGRIDLGRLRRMSELLRHRGPDDEGMVLLDPEGGHSLTLAGPAQVSAEAGQTTSGFGYTGNTCCAKKSVLLRKR